MPQLGITEKENGNSVGRCFARFDDADPVIRELKVASRQFNLWHMTGCALLLAYGARCS